MDNNKSMENETKKLTFLVLYLSIFVLILFGLESLV